jgi:hypothetical protein
MRNTESEVNRHSELVACSIRNTTYFGEKTMLPILLNLYLALKFLFWDNLTYTIIVLIFGWILMSLWGRAQKRAEQGLNGLWHLLFSWLYFILEVATAVALVVVVTRGSVLFYSFTRDQLHLGASDAGRAGGFDVTSTPGPLTIFGSTRPNQTNTTPTPLTRLQSFAGVSSTYVTNQSATVRIDCTQSSQTLGEIPAGTTVQLGPPVDSNCVSGICLRAIIKSVDPKPSGFDPVGGCLHLAAVTKK